MKDLSDGQLLRAWRDGQAGAFTEIVLRHQDSLLRHARGTLGPGSAYEDVVQEVFLKLARERLVLSSEGRGEAEEERRQLSAWLHTVARNACMDSIRSETRRRRREREVASPERGDGHVDPIEGADTRAVVERELQELPVDQREVLVLRLLAEKSYREIAEITGRKIGTVGWLISEGVKALGARLEPLLSPDAGVQMAPARESDWNAMRGGIR